MHRLPLSTPSSNGALRLNARLSSPESTRTNRTSKVFFSFGEISRSSQPSLALAPRNHALRAGFPGAWSGRLLRRPRLAVDARRGGVCCPKRNGRRVAAARADKTDLGKSRPVGYKPNPFFLLDSEPPASNLCLLPPHHSSRIFLTRPPPQSVTFLPIWFRTAAPSRDGADSIACLVQLASFTFQLD